MNMELDMFADSLTLMSSRKTEPGKGVTHQRAGSLLSEASIQAALTTCLLLLEAHVLVTCSSLLQPQVMHCYSEWLLQFA